jgi:hypothetical protein
MKEITDPGKKGHKKKTNQNDIHKSQLPPERREMLQPGHNWRVCALLHGVVKGAENRG